MPKGINTVGYSMPYPHSKRPKLMDVAKSDPPDENEGLTRTSASIQSLPTETITHIFGYLTSQPKTKDIRKDHLYHAALTCRHYARIAIPMLWYEFRFTLSDEAPSKEPYQDSFLAMLNEDMYKNFVYTQKLYFNISNMSKPITNERNASVLRHRLEQFLAIYKSAAHVLKSLGLLLQPFIPTDCMVDELWPSVNGCNDLIYTIIGEIVHRDSDFEIFDLFLGTGAWTYDVSFRPHLYQLLRLTATKITSLGLTEHPNAITPYLPEMRSLRKLRFHAIGEHDEEQTRSIWKAVSGLPLREVSLDQLDGSYDFQLFVPQTLTRITMNGVDDIVAACVVCYTQFPNLEHCCLNNGKLKDPKSAPTAVVTETVCTKLFQVCFLNSICPAGIISTIARRNHNLRMCLAPPNVTDEDVRLLRANCPSLRTFLMSTANFNSVVPACLISRSGLEHFVHLRRLQTVALHSELLPVVDISLLSSIAKSNSILETLMLLFPDDRHKMWTRQDVREKLSGNESFKELFIGLMKESANWPPIWAIEGPDLRTTLC